MTAKRAATLVEHGISTGESAIFDISSRSSLNLSPSPRPDTPELLAISPSHSIHSLWVYCEIWYIHSELSWRKVIAGFSSFALPTTSRLNGLDNAKSSIVSIIWSSFHSQELPSDSFHSPCRPPRRQGKDESRLRRFPNCCWGGSILTQDRSLDFICPWSRDQPDTNPNLQHLDFLPRRIEYSQQSAFRPGGVRWECLPLCAMGSQCRHQEQGRCHRRKW